jgi:hypothetical protein
VSRTDEDERLYSLAVKIYTGAIMRGDFERTDNLVQNAAIEFGRPGPAVLTFIHADPDSRDAMTEALNLKAAGEAGVFARSRGLRTQDGHSVLERIRRGSR